MTAELSSITPNTSLRGVVVSLPVKPADELQAMANAIKKQQPQPKRREVTGPFPIRWAQPERKPQPYLLVKKQGGAA